ncbi:MAG: (d)CMP kinase [Alphaproteobacteria bacterium]
MAEPAKPTIIAIDGPAAAGKGTLARRLAARLGLRYLESGRLYRAVAARVLREGGDPADPAQAVIAARALDDADVAADDLRDEAVSQAASVVSAIPEVRAALLEYQRRFGRTPPGAVIDGRDIGTVVFPDATHKLFVTARPAVRAERRYRELRARGVVCERAEVAREMALRDARDAGREVAPMAAATDGVVLDTSDLDAEAVYRAALAALGLDPDPAE